MRLAIKYEEVQDHLRRKAESYKVRAEGDKKRASDPKLSENVRSFSDIRAMNCEVLAAKFAFAASHLEDTSTLYLEVSELIYWEFLEK